MSINLLQLRKSSRGELCLIVHHSSNLGLPGEDVDPVKAVITENGKCSIFIPFRPVDIRNLLLLGELLEEEFHKVLHTILGNEYAYCPGIPYKDVHLPKGIIIFRHPYLRMQSENCEVWYKTTPQSKKKIVVQCQRCCTSANTLFVSQKRRTSVSPIRYNKRQKVDSTVSFHSLTPKSQRARLASLKRARRCLKHRVDKLEAQVAHRDLMLEDEQSHEMETVVNIINKNHTTELKEMFEEQGENKKILKNVWDRDSEFRQNKDVRSFFEDQRFCSNSSKANRWSSITLRIALAIYCRSPAAYEALKSFNILQLPSVPTIQRKSAKFNSAPGLDHSYLLEQKEKYHLMKLEKLKFGEVVPASDGVLIFDEVKVIEKVMWNSKNHKFMGFAMNKDEYPLLNDVLKFEEKEPAATQYVLQFLWRDLTSNFDVIGPYFTFKSSIESQLLLGCILQTMRGLQAYSFHTTALVCDGASDNLSTIKLSMGFKGAFGDSELLPYFENPFCEPGRKVFWIICPSHEMKSMISALHSSREKGTKEFSRRNVIFGWKQIQDLKKREDERLRKGQMRCVPRLLESFIIRDSWTRLNVKPSKIFQQENVLSELYSFANGNEGCERSRDSAIECYNYLRACNRIFEQGLLSSGMIKGSDSSELKSISQGFSYFLGWLEEIKMENPNVNLTATNQRVFLSWQTWDLLRICVKGFQMLCEDFFKRHPNNFISPARINGSAVESLFSQFKYATGSKLSGINYMTARKSVLVKRNVHGGNTSNKDYRDVPLYIRESDI